MAEPYALVVGVGNCDRGDDAAGLEVARRVCAAGRSGLVVHEDTGDVAELMGAWTGMGTVFLVDAVAPAGTPGRIVRFDAVNEPLPAIFTSHMSSHGLGIVEAVELARTLGDLPESLIVYGIEGASFVAGNPMSSVVESAVNETRCRILEELDRHTSLAESAQAR